MNRVDRLVAMILLLQSKRSITADEIASHFEISVRTVYRDVTALGEAGVPVIAEAGVGYSLMKGYHLPPVMFTQSEAMALAMGGALVDSLTDPAMQQQMKNQKPGSGSCDNPGGSGGGKGKKPMTMEEMKQALSEQIGKMKGGKKPGGEEGKGERKDRGGES